MSTKPQKSPKVFVKNDSFDTKEVWFNNLPLSLKKLANAKNQMDGIDFLKMFQNESIPAVFFDPQYRGVLDKMNYGNEGCRQKGRSELSQMDDATIVEFLKEINRTLVKSGHLFLWVDKFHLVEGVKSWFDGTNIEIVDMVTWDKGKIGMGYRTRRKSEYLIIAQKAPKRVKGVWLSHDIPDVWMEKVEKRHPHSKPEKLQERLISSVVKNGDFVVDPASGGYSVFRSAKNVGRNFLGCDLLPITDEQIIMSEKDDKS